MASSIESILRLADPGVILDPLLLNHAALEHYYQLHGRDWEQYAMVKATGH